MRLIFIIALILCKYFCEQLCKHEHTSTQTANFLIMGKLYLPSALQTCWCVGGSEAIGWLSFSSDIVIDDRTVPSPYLISFCYWNVLFRKVTGSHFNFFQVFRLSPVHYSQEVFLSICRRFASSVRLVIKSEFSASREKWLLIGPLGWVLSEHTVLWTINVLPQFMQQCSSASTALVIKTDKKRTGCTID